MSESLIFKAYKILVVLYSTFLTGLYSRIITMSTDIRNITEIAPDIPNIVITEPSPLIVSNVSAISAKNPVTPSSTSEPTATPTSTDTQSTAVSTAQSPNGKAVNIQEELEPSGVKIDSTVTIEQAREVSTVDGTNIEVQESGDVPADDDFRHRPFYNGAFECFLNWTTFINSKYMLPIQILLLAVPISAGYMGAKYLDKCPMSNATPIFLFMMGVAGCLVIFCHMILVLTEVFSAREREWGVLTTIAIFAELAVLLMLCTETVIFFRLSPDFQFGAPNYCHKTFYTYTYWMNCIGILLVLIIAALHVPKCSLRASRIEREP